MSGMLDVRACAKRMNVSPDQVRRYIGDGELRASKLGRWRVEPRDLEAFIKSRRNTVDLGLEDLHEPVADGDLLLPNIGPNPFD